MLSEKMLTLEVPEYIVDKLAQAELFRGSLAIWQIRYYQAIPCPEECAETVVLFDEEFDPVCGGVAECVQFIQAHCKEISDKYKSELEECLERSVVPGKELRQSVELETGYTLLPMEWWRRNAPEIFLTEEDATKWLEYRLHEYTGNPEKRDPYIRKNIQVSRCIPELAELVKIAKEATSDFSS